MSEEKILTLHPQGKNGVNISKAKYDQMRAAIVDVLDRYGDMTFTELANCLEGELAGKFDGSVKWYCVSVKQDLEARGVLRFRPKTKPPCWYVDHSTKLE